MVCLGFEPTVTGDEGLKAQKKPLSYGGFPPLNKSYWWNAEMRRLRKNETEIEREREKREKERDKQRQ